MKKKMRYFILNEINSKQVKIEKVSIKYYQNPIDAANKLINFYITSKNYKKNNIKFFITEITNSIKKVYGPYKYNNGKVVKNIYNYTSKLNKKMIGGNNKIEIQNNGDLFNLIKVIQIKEFSILKDVDKELLKKYNINIKIIKEEMNATKMNATKMNAKRINNNSNSELHYNIRLSNLDINTYNIISMESLFENFDFINHSCDDVDISKWNVNRVKNMKCMFKKSKGFNQNLNKWNLLTDNEENYKTMYLDYMFEGCENFCENILDSLNWKVYKNSSLTGMFEGCEQLFYKKVIEEYYTTFTEKYLNYKIKIKYIGKNGNELMTIKLVNGIYGYNCMFNGKHCTAFD